MSIPDPAPLPAFNNPPEQPRPDKELLRRQLLRIALAALGVGILCATCMPVLAAILAAAAVGGGGVKWLKKVLHNVEGKNVDAKNLLVEAVSVCMKENDLPRLTVLLEHALERGVDPVMVGEQYRRCCEYLVETGVASADELAAFTKRMDAAIEKAAQRPSISASKALNRSVINNVLSADPPPLLAAEPTGESPPGPGAPAAPINPAPQGPAAASQVPPPAAAAGPALAQAGYAGTPVAAAQVQPVTAAGAHAAGLAPARLGAYGAGLRQAAGNNFPPAAGPAASGPGGLALGGG